MIGAGRCRRIFPVGHEESSPGGYLPDRQGRAEGTASEGRGMVINGERFLVSGENAGGGGGAWIFF